MVATSYREVQDSEVDGLSPMTDVLMLALASNPKGIAAGVVGADRIQTAAIEVDASLEATARDATAGAVGTYALLSVYQDNSAVITANTPYAGSTLAYAGIGMEWFEDADDLRLVKSSGISASTLSGTWRAMGTCNSVDVEPGGTAADYFAATLFLRIA